LDRRSAVIAAHVRASAHNYRLQKGAGFPHDAGTSKPLPE
jgi:hypothetical protein